MDPQLLGDVTEIDTPLDQCLNQRECSSTDGVIGEEGHMLGLEDFMTTPGS
jgi:hypothetical protein